MPKIPEETQLIPLGPVVPQQHVKVMHVQPDRLTFYTAYVWKDGHLQVGYPDLTLNAQEIATLLAILTVAALSTRGSA